MDRKQRVPSAALFEAERNRVNNVRLDGRHRVRPKAFIIINIIIYFIFLKIMQGPMIWSCLMRLKTLVVLSHGRIA